MGVSHGLAIQITGGTESGESNVTATIPATIATTTVRSKKEDNKDIDNKCNKCERRGHIAKDCEIFLAPTPAIFGPILIPF